MLTLSALALDKQNRVSRESNSWRPEDVDVVDGAVGVLAISILKQMKFLWFRVYAINEHASRVRHAEDLYAEPNQTITSNFLLMSSRASPSRDSISFCCAFQRNFRHKNRNYFEFRISHAVGNAYSFIHVFTRMRVCVGATETTTGRR